MPYIPQHRRKQFEPEIVSLVTRIESEGELNYIFMRLAILLLKKMGKLSYGNLNRIMGVLDCVQAEFYRRIVAPYEDGKIRENGDI